MTRRCQLCGATGVLQRIGSMSVCVRQCCQSVARDAARDYRRMHPFLQEADCTRDHGVPFQSGALFCGDCLRTCHEAQGRRLVRQVDIPPTPRLYRD